MVVGIKEMSRQASRPNFLSAFSPILNAVNPRNKAKIEGIMRKNVSRELVVNQDSDAVKV